MLLSSYCLPKLCQAFKNNKTKLNKNLNPKFQPLGNSQPTGRNQHTSQEKAIKELKGHACLFTEGAASVYLLLTNQGRTNQEQPGWPAAYEVVLPTYSLIYPSSEFRI